MEKHAHEGGLTRPPMDGRPKDKWLLIIVPNYGRFGRDIDVQIAKSKEIKILDCTGPLRSRD